MNFLMREEEEELDEELKVSTLQARRYLHNCKRGTSFSIKSQTRVKMEAFGSLLLVLLALLAQAGRAASSGPTSALKFEPDSNAYSGLTFTFDPRLDKRVDGLHFEHWHSIVQQSSGLLYEALNGRAHLAEVRVLIPYKWRHYNWPILHKPGALINRRLRYSDSDVIVGFEGKYLG